MLFIVGLGNPGSQYQSNRHNIGFMAVDEIHRCNASFSPWGKKFQAELSDGMLNGEKVYLLKPQTYMNLSGQSIGEAMRFYKASLDDLIVFYDDLDLAPGKIRIKKGGGSGGHNGIKSIDAHCGNDYRRVRLGIGHPGTKELVHNYVLGNFSVADQNWLEPLLKSIGENVIFLAKNQDSNFMNKVSLALKSDSKENTKPEKPAPTHLKSTLNPKKTNSFNKTEPSGPMAQMLKKLFSGKDA